MQVVSSTPFRVASLLWQPNAGSFAFTVLCKATFLLRPGESPLAPQQEAMYKEDAHWGHDPMRCLRWASDLAPRKPRADVVLVGQAYAPGKVPVRSLVARLAVGEIDKSIEVMCPRYYDPAGALRDGPPFAQMPLTYERAAAGPENPAGMRPGTRDSMGRAEVPNLLPTGLGGRTDGIGPIGFGPIAATWPLRLEKLGRHASGWDHVKWYRQPLDTDIDMSYFNSAPPDQQVPSLRDDERITLENLHPEHAILVTCLPGIHPVASVELAGAAPFPLALRCDTLVINTEALICTLVFRGHFPVSDPRVEGRVVIGMEGAGRAGPASHDVLQETAAALPDAAASAEQAVPFHAGSGPSTIVNAPPSIKPKRSGDTMSIPVYPGSPGPPSQSYVSVVQSPPLPPPPPSLSTPPYATPPLADPPAADPAPVPLTIGQALAAQAASGPSSGSAAQASSHRAGTPEMLAPIPSEEDTESGLVAEVGAGGVLAASNAAATPVVDAFGARSARAEVPSLRAGAGAAAGHEVLRVVWFDVDGVPRMRRKPEFKAILDELAKRPPDRDADDARVDETPADIEDRREMTEVLLRASPVSAEGVRGAINHGIRDDGRYVPSVVVLHGQLEMTFDAVETLKCLLPVAASFAGTDDALASAVAGASVFLNTPGIPSPLIAETLAGRVRTAFLQTRKNLKAEALDGPAERVLVEQRMYRRRPVFGDVFVRALVHLAGSPYAVPAYFPESAARKLPLHRKYKVRLVAETHLAADPAESHPAALRALALAEVLPGGLR